MLSLTSILFYFNLSKFAYTSSIDSVCFMFMYNLYAQSIKYNLMRTLSKASVNLPVQTVLHAREDNLLHNP